MELFERIDLIAKKYAGSRTKMAESLSIQQRTFDGYFSLKRQKNFWEILPSILEAYPFISRNWLYFGEGEITGQTGNCVAASDSREKELLLKLEKANDLLIQKEEKINYLEKIINRLENGLECRADKQQ